MTSLGFVVLAAVIVSSLFIRVASYIFKREPGRILAWALFSIMIISLAFGLCYSGSEGIASSEGTVETGFLNCVYFSVMTLTNVGYGDYRPCTSHGKVLAMIEGFVGFFFLGVFVAAFYGQVYRRISSQRTI